MNHFVSLGHLIAVKWKNCHKEIIAEAVWKTKTITELNLLMLKVLVHHHRSSEKLNKIKKKKKSKQIQKSQLPKFKVKSTEDETKGIDVLL